MNEPLSPAPGRGRLSKLSRRSELRQLPWRQVSNPYPPIEVVTADQLERIHQTSLDILEEIGIDFRLPEARVRLGVAGVEVTPGEERVRLDRFMVEELIAKAPPSFTLHTRNPAHDLIIGGNHMNFCTVAGPPYASDLEGGRRTGTQRDYRDFLRLAQCLNIIHMIGGYPVEAQDLPAATRHLDCVSDMVTLTDKAFGVHSLSRACALDALEIVRIARAISEEDLAWQPSMATVINTNSPLRIDAPMLHGIIEMSSRNQAIVVTPFTLAGAMAPITLAGALAQQNAEALACIAFAQIVSPGAPVIYGGFTSNVDMRSGSPVFGTPEYVRAAQIGGQLARRYRIPYRSSNVNASNCVDAQAIYESQMSLWAATLGHANVLMHAAGWLEGGLCASFEKMIVDAEMLQQMAEYFLPVDVSDEALTLDAIREVGPGGHFFAAEQTRKRYETAFYAPMISDWRGFDSWRESGALTAVDRAHTLYRRFLDAYAEPPMDAAVRDELDAYVAKRKEEGGLLSED